MPKNAVAKKGLDFESTFEKIRIRSLEDLIDLNLSTLEDVVAGTIDNRKASLIFTGSRTVSSALKLGIEAMKLGLREIAGIPLGQLKVVNGEKIDEGKGQIIKK